MAFSHQNKPLSIFKILCEAFKLPTKSCTLILPIFFFSFLTSSLLLISLYLTIKPVIADLASNSISIASLDPKSPEYALILAAILKDLKELIGIEAIFVIAASIFSSLTIIATIHAFSLVCSGKISTIKDLLCRIGRGLKGPLITILYVKLLSTGYFFVMLALVGIFMLIAHGSTILMAVSTVILALLGLILYVYLAMVWSVSVVISVVEDACYGLKAISRAGEVIRGRRMQGVMLLLIEFVSTFLVFAIYYLVKVYAPSTIVQVLAGLVYIVIGVLMSMFAWAVIMVFYSDCKRSDGGEGITIAGGFMYANVPTAAYDEV